VQKGLVEKVVGRTFDSSVLESPQNVFLEVYILFYKTFLSYFQCIILFFCRWPYSFLLCETKVHTPWCVDCEAISKNIEKLARHFSGLEDLKFARIDASVNEHPKLQVSQSLHYHHIAKGIDKS
jgi:protein disulfide-isomerase A1